MDMSNKTLAFFLIAAIVVSIAGTMISLDKLNKFEGTSGFATVDTGNVSLSVTKLASIVFSTNQIDWGSGSVNAGYNNCTMYTNVSATDSGNTSLGCKDFSNVGEGLVLSNNGNLDVNVTFNFSGNNSVIGGLAVEPNIWFNITENGTLGECGANLDVMAVNGRDEGLYPANISWPSINGTMVSSEKETVCSNFSWDGGASGNKLVTNIRVVIPSDSNVGLMEWNITATAEALSTKS